MTQEQAGTTAATLPATLRAMSNEELIAAYKEAVRVRDYCRRAHELAQVELDYVRLEVETRRIEVTNAK